MKGYLLYHNVNLSDEKEEGARDTTEDFTEVGLDILLVGNRAASFSKNCAELWKQNTPSEHLDTIFSSRVVSEVHADVEDHENAARLAKAGLKHLAELESNLGTKLTK